MSSTLTVRIDPALREALEQKASAQGKSISALVRDILEEAVKEKPVSARAGHLRGSLHLPSEDDDPWRQQIRERNWRS